MRLGGKSRGSRSTNHRLFTSRLGVNLNYLLVQDTMHESYPKEIRIHVTFKVTHYYCSGTSSSPADSIDLASFLPIIGLFPWVILTLFTPSPQFPIHDILFTAADDGRLIDMSIQKWLKSVKKCG